MNVNRLHHGLALGQASQGAFDGRRCCGCAVQAKGRCTTKSCKYKCQSGLHHHGDKREEIKLARHLRRGGGGGCKRSRTRKEKIPKIRCKKARVRIAVSSYCLLFETEDGVIPHRLQTDRLTNITMALSLLNYFVFDVQV